MPELTDEHRKNLAAWVADLRTGGPQIKSRLCGVTAEGEVIGHCCLGRLQDLAMREWGIKAEITITDTELDGEVGYDYERSYNGVTAFPTDEVSLKIGDVQYVTVDLNDGHGKRFVPFYTLNDDYDWTFGEIADAIEAEYL